jgi:hypothetical protein
MIGAVWFTYRDDGLALAESVRAFRRTFPGAPVCLLDEEKNPLIPEHLAALAPDYYGTRSSWGNLNGWPACEFILETQEMLCTQFALDGIIKLDSDTLLLTSRWLDPAVPFIGVSIGQQLYASGLMRYQRAGVSWDLLQAMKNRFRVASYPAPEDQTISAEALAAHGPACRILPWNGTAAFLAGTWQWEGLPLRQDPGDYDVITFPRCRLKDGKPCDKQEAQALAMASVLAATAPQI